ncbi:MAG: PilZ domain-containing protein [Vulcanimicrobiaceae bacterium]
MSEPRRQAVRIEVNTEVAVLLPDLGRELRLLLVDISESGALLRTPFKLPANGRIAFNWVGPSRERIPVGGYVVSARPTDGARTVDYGVTFAMTPGDRERLVRELVEVQRRRAFHAGRESSKGGRERRRGYRAPLKFPVHARANKGGRWTGVRAGAHDISMGGMLIALPGEHDDGTELQVTFTLPLHAVDQGGEETVTVEQTPFGPRRVKKTAAIRPFEPIETNARIVHKRGVQAGTQLYGVTFGDFSEFLQEEIARFVHAYQVTQLRKSAAQGE